MAQAKRKKKFFSVECPIINKEFQVLGYEIEEVEGKTIKYDLTRMLRGKSMEIELKIHVKGKEAIALPRGIELMGYYLRRMIRKGTNYVEDSFPVTCKDAILRIKPFMLTRKKVSRSVRNALRVKTKEELTEYAKNKTAEQVFEDMLDNRIQRPLSLKLKKIYPLALCEIRILKIEKDL